LTQPGKDCEATLTTTTTTWDFLSFFFPSSRIHAKKTKPPNRISAFARITEQNRWRREREENKIAPSSPTHNTHKFQTKKYR
jgi:hypothetical protein